MSPPNDPTEGVLLCGLHGDNPLAFLATIGTLRVLSVSAAGHDWKLHWVRNAGTWSPRLSARCDIQLGEVHEQLRDALQVQDGEHPILKIHEAIEERIGRAKEEGRKTGTWDAEIFRTITELAHKKAHPHDHLLADFVAGLGNESAVDDKDKVHATAFMLLRSHEYLKNMNNIVSDNVTLKDVEATLSNRWEYADEGRARNLRLEPRSDRRYALRWKNPTSKGEEIRTMKAANRLAVEALPMFPVVPAGRSLATTGFTNENRKFIFNWPIWSLPLDIENIRSLLALR